MFAIIITYSVQVRRKWIRYIASTGARDAVHENYNNVNHGHGMWGRECKIRTDDNNCNQHTKCNCILSPYIVGKVYITRTSVQLKSAVMLVMTSDFCRNTISVISNIQAKINIYLCERANTLTPLPLGPALQLMPVIHVDFSFLALVHPSPFWLYLFAHFRKARFEWSPLAGPYNLYACVYGMAEHRIVPIVPCIRPRQT